MPNNEKLMSFWEHLEELRWGIFKAMAILLVSTTICTIFVDSLFEIFMAPLKLMIDQKKVILNQTGPFDGIFIKMKTGLIGGLVIAFPFMFLILWGFISPGLKKDERNAFWWIFSSICILFMTGIILGYYSLFIMLPILMSMGIENADNIWRLNDYISFLFYWELSAGAIMELPLAIIITVRLGLLELPTLRKWRPYAFLGMFVLSAVITADPISLIVLGFILYLFYEAGIFASSLQKKRKDDIL